MPTSQVFVRKRPAEMTWLSMSWCGATRLIIGSFAISATSPGVIVRSVADWREPTLMYSPSTSTTFAPSRSMLAAIWRRGSVADGRHGDQRGHADDDAQRRQQRAEPVRPQRAERDPPVLPGRGHPAPTASRPPTCSSETIDAVGQSHDARCPLGDLVRVGDHRERRACAVDALEQSEHLLLAGGVEVAGRLVEQEHAGLHDERAGDGDALLLAARELRREMAGAIGEADLAEPGEHAAATLSRRHSGVHERQLDVAIGTRARQQVVGLEHEADALAANVRATRLVERRHLLAHELVGAGRRTVEAAEDGEQRRLARAGRAHDRDELALADHRGSRIARPGRRPRPSRRPC